MADSPFAAVGMAEQAGGGEEEPAPAPHPHMGLVTIDAAQDGFDGIAVAVEIGEPVERGTLVVNAALAPFLLDLEQIGILPDQMMARHHTTGEEMLRDPVLAVGAIEQIGAGTMGEDMHEQAPVGFKP